MSDVFSKSKRSAVMAAIRSCGNKDTEIVLAKLLRAHHITGWRRKWPVFGKPDFAFPKRRLAVFVDGCFWHQCPKHCQMPRGNRAFWVRKFAANKARDRKVGRILRKAGWTVVRFWEHELAKPDRVMGKLGRLLPKSEE